MFPLCNSEMGLGVHSDRTNSNLASTPTTRAGGGCLAATARGLVPLNVPGTRPVSLQSGTPRPRVRAGERVRARVAARRRARSRVCAGASAPPGARGRGRARARARRGGPGWSARYAPAEKRAGGAGARLPVRSQGGLLRPPGRALLPGECGLLYPGQGGRAGGRPGSGSLRPARQ